MSMLKVDIMALRRRAASGHGYEEIARGLLETNGADANAQGEGYATPLGSRFRGVGAIAIVQVAVG